MDQQGHTKEINTFLPLNHIICNDQLICNDQRFLYGTLLIFRGRKHQLVSARFQAIYQV